MSRNNPSDNKADTTPNVIFAPQLFSASARLTAKEQSRVIEFINKFQENPAHPGLQLHTIDNTRSAGMWSGRVTRDIRAILHKDGETWAILHVDHHDAAYTWAERRDVGRHPITGALQIVEAIETVREVEKIVHVAAKAPPIFVDHQDGYLLSLGLPESWLPVVRAVRAEDQLLSFMDKLPEDVVERLMKVAEGELVTPPEPIAPDRPVIESADTRDTFYIASDSDELAAALRAPLDRWIAFLHHSQRALVQRTFSGPAKVTGSAGTGKTVVAMHRARKLARDGEHVLLTSYVSTLCENIERNLVKLCTPAEHENITVSTVHKQALRLVRDVEPRTRPATDEDVHAILDNLRSLHAPDHDSDFVRAEWHAVVRRQNIANWPEYRRARRTGRGRGLAVKERKLLWQIFGQTLETLEKRCLLDWTGLCRRARELIENGQVTSPFTAVIVDEVQDLDIAAIRLVHAMSSPENLMLCGDAGQRIYPSGFSLSALGIQVRGRSMVLRLNYRTTEQIRRLADRMLGTASDDMDGGEESRVGTRSLLTGPSPELTGHPNREAENQAGVARIQSWLDDGLTSNDIGVFARTGNRVTAFGRALSDAKLSWRRLSDKEPSADNRPAIHLGTMHRAKGLEFKAVLVLDASEGRLPSTHVLGQQNDPLDREGAQVREKCLLYVAMTRARDHLAISWIRQPCAFIAPLTAKSEETSP